MELSLELSLTGGSGGGIGAVLDVASTYEDYDIETYEDGDIVT